VQDLHRRARRRRGAGRLPARPRRQRCRPDVPGVPAFKRRRSPDAHRKALAARASRQRLPDRPAGGGRRRAQSALSDRRARTLPVGTLPARHHGGWPAAQLFDGQSGAGERRCRAARPPPAGRPVFRNRPRTRPDRGHARDRASVRSVLSARHAGPGRAVGDRHLLRSNRSSSRRCGRATIDRCGYIGAPAGGTISPYSSASHGGSSARRGSRSCRSSPGAPIGTGGPDRFSARRSPTTPT
jgi:hypothetical protein